MTSIVKTWGLRLLWILVCCAVVYGNYKFLETKNARITVLEENLKTITAERNVLKRTLALKNSSDKATDTAVTATKQDETKHEIAKTKAAVYVDTKLKEIEMKYAEQPVTEASEQRKAMEISLERAKGMWLAYCLQEPAEKACK